MNWHHFSPRVGATYQLTPKTVVLGGVSWYWLDTGAFEYGVNKVAVNYGNNLNGVATSEDARGSYTERGPTDPRQVRGVGESRCVSRLGEGRPVGTRMTSICLLPCTREFSRCHIALCNPSAPKVPPSPPPINACSRTHGRARLRLWIHMAIQRVRVLSPDQRKLSSRRKASRKSRILRVLAGTLGGR